MNLDIRPVAVSKRIKGNSRNLTHSSVSTGLGSTAAYVKKSVVAPEEVAFNLIDCLQ